MRPILPQKMDAADADHVEFGSFSSRFHVCGVFPRTAGYHSDRKPTVQSISCAVHKHGPPLQPLRFKPRGGSGKPPKL